MDPRIWDNLTREQRRQHLRSGGMKGESVEENAKLNFDYLAEEVKRIVSTEQETPSDILTKEGLRKIERKAFVPVRPKR
jgi:hypothetical protein